MYGGSTILGQEWFEAKPVVTAAVIVVVSIIVGWCTRKCGSWMNAAMSRSFASAVLEAITPELETTRSMVTTAIDDMTAQNTREHAATSERLSNVEGRLSSVEDQLAEVRKLVIRPSTQRTRSTDEPVLHE